MSDHSQSHATEFHNPLRRALLVTMLAMPISAIAQSATTIDVWKTPECGCCKDWIKHLQSNGFQVVAHDVGDTSEMRRKLSMPEQYGSCHSGSVNGYALEGHVPAKEIRRLLRERPAAVGLSVPAMPLGAPGMDGPEYQGRSFPYEVLLVGKNGKTSVYQAYK
ncbi:DUF411 domain-containing protein [Pigmentiphaga litoralis]|uniref:DUF411 domain-containing protein n=2 Tax=Pigmentiphaga litoralis TaxID=516702 RepID=UPI003B432016